MEREDRYLIIKRKDIGAYLTAPEEEALDDISRKINRNRLMDGKSALTAVVVEHDWPEYGPTWVVQRGELVDVLRQIDEIRQLIADDGFACTFQTLGQYRTALLKSLTATAEEAFNAEQAKTGGMPYGTYGGF